MTRNHIVKAGYNLDLAMIEGTPIEVWCGLRFVPTVTVGTSGRADIPGAPDCERCKKIVSSWRDWIRMKDEKNRLIREMRALEKLQRERIRDWSQDDERVPEMAP